jgi:hypothetical protein
LEALEQRMLLATIQGSLLEDMNADGDITTDPPLQLAEVTIYLDENNNGVWDEDEISTVTATDGTYQFPNLDVGDYTVAQVIPKNWLQTSPTPAAAPSQLGDVQRDFDLAGLEAGPVGMALNNVADVLYVVDIDMGIYPVDPTTGQTPVGATDFTKPTSGTWDITIDSAGNFWGVDPAADLVVKFRQSQSDPSQAQILQQFPAPNPQAGDPYPVGIAWDHTDNTLWIADRDFQEIYHVDPVNEALICLLYTSPSPRDRQKSRMPSSA